MKLKKQCIYAISSSVFLISLSGCGGSTAEPNDPLSMGQTTVVDRQSEVLGFSDTRVRRERDRSRTRDRDRSRDRTRDNGETRTSDNRETDGAVTKSTVDSNDSQTTAKKTPTVEPTTSPSPSAKPSTSSDRIFTGSSPFGHGEFSIGGHDFGYAYWASGSGFFNDKSQHEDLAAYVRRANAANRVAPIVVYGLGDINGGSAQEVAQYDDFIKVISDAIGSAKAEIFFEPDITGLHSARLNDQSIINAIASFDRNNPNATILLDVAHSLWKADLSEYINAYTNLVNVGLDGFIGNISNYRPNQELAEWMHRELYNVFGDQLIYAVDTSRNGASPLPAGVVRGEWADVAGAGLGEKTGGSMEYKGMTLEFRHVKPATEADARPYPGATVPASRLRALFDNSIFSKASASLAAPTPSSDAPSGVSSQPIVELNEQPIARRPSDDLGLPSGRVIYQQDFSNIPTGPVTSSSERDYKQTLGNDLLYLKAFGANDQNTNSADEKGREAAGQVNDANSIIRIGNDQGALKVLYPSGGNTSSHSGAQYLDSIIGTPTGAGDSGQLNPEEILISYNVRFEQDFQWQGGGKLPGVHVGRYFNDREERTSVRLMWREDGKMEFYMHSDYDDRTRLLFNEIEGQSFRHAKVSDTQWHTIAYRIQLNTVRNGEAIADGELEAWIDGERVAHYTDVAIRGDSSATVSAFFFSTFYGGSSGNGSQVWWPTRDTTAWFDDIVIEEL